MASAYRRPRRSAARRTSSGSGWQLRQRTGLRGELLIDRGGLERQLEYLADQHHRMEGNLIPHVLGDVVEVAAVALRDDHVGDPGRVCGEHLLLQSADGQHA